ncbi:hypothetical protein BKN38_09240 [Helicobacter sp. CLO-3]|nr:hypothetical protein BA723_08500 [Helicobacter sp. CLO-3]OHU81356.1 hypothetical protein BKN38_09240 [Helicobacter sp. CLO-3]
MLSKINFVLFCDFCAGFCGFWHDFGVHILASSLFGVCLACWLLARLFYFVYDFAKFFKDFYAFD